MADVSKTVEIIFGGKNEMSGAVNSVMGSLGKAEAAIEKIATPLAKLADGILATDAALATLAVGAIALATKSAGDFGDQIAEISTLTEATAEDLGAFRANILDYSRDSKKSIDDINSAIYQAVSLGTDYKDSLDLLSTTEKLSVAGRADLTRTTELLAGTMNAYGASASDAAKYSDVFFTTVKLGKTTIPELADSIAHVSGLAANAGVPIETLSSAIAALTAAGEPTTEAMTGIRAALSNIIDPGQKAIKMAKELGIEFGASALKTKGFEGVMKEVYTATGGNVEKIAGLFESTKALNTVLTLGADKSGKFAEALKAMEVAAGATEAAYGKMVNNFALINQNLANNLKATLIDVGEPLLDAYGDTASALSGIFKGLSIGMDAGSFDPLFDALTGLGDKVSSFVQGISDALPEALVDVDFSPIINALSSLGGALGDFFGDLDLTSPEDLAEAMQFAVDTIASLISVTQGMAEQFRPIWDAIYEGVKAFNSSDAETQKLAGNVLGAAKQIKDFGIVMTGMVTVLNAFGLTIIDVADHIGVVAGRLEGYVKILWGLHKLDFGMVASGWRQAFDYMYEGSEKAGESTKKTGEAFEATNKIIGDGGKEAAQKLADTTRSTAQIAEEFRQIWGEAATVVADEALPKVDDGVREIRKSTGELIRVWEDNQGVTHFQEIGGAAEETAAKIKKMPKSLEFELKVKKLDIAQFDAETKRISSLLDFKAKIDIAQIEAGTKQMEAMFSSVNTSILSTGDSLSSLFSSLVEPGVAGSKKNEILRQIDEENRRRDEALQLQKEAIRAQIDLLRAKERVIERGDSIVNVSADGLKPHLEAFMWEILSAIQVRVNEEGSEMLLGLSS